MNKDGVKDWYFYTAKNAHEYIKATYGDDDRNINLQGDIGNIPEGAEGFIIYYNFIGDSGHRYDHIDYYYDNQVVGKDYSGRGGSMHFVRTN